MLDKNIKFTEDDCYQVLAKFYNNIPVKLIKYSLVSISDEVNGYMGKHLLLTAEVENGAKTESLRFFVKTQPIENEAITEFAKAGNVFNKEIMWYKFLERVKEKCPIFEVSFSPKYYFSREDEFIVLEDLYNSGCRMTTKLHLDMEHLQLAIKSIAKYHAASIIFEEIKSKELGRRYQLIEDYGEWLQESMYRDDTNYLGYKYIHCGKRALYALIDLLPEEGLSAKDFKEKLSNLVNQAFADSKPSEHFRNVWCNGDLWAKNIMFKYENQLPIECKIFDFQLQRYNPPAHDVFFMIYESTSKIERQRYLEYYLDFYYETLTRELKRFDIDINEVLGRDEFDISCTKAIPVIKLSKTLYVTISAVSQERIKKVTKDQDFYAKLTFNDRSEFVVDVFNSESEYRKIMTDFLEDLRDVLEHEKITIEDCYKILTKKIGTSAYELLEYKVIPFGEKLGFLGEHSNLKIKIRQSSDSGNDVKELSFFVKSPPKEHGQKNFVIASNLFLKEIKLYTKFVSEMLANNVTCIKECLSDCYLARLNDVLVFDDYTERGYITFNSRTPYNYETVILIIKKLAKFHASFLILEEKLNCSGQNYRYGNHYKKELGEPFYSDLKSHRDAIDAAIKGTLTLIDLFPCPDARIHSSVFKKRVTKLFNKLQEYVKPSHKYRNTICHGDLWSNNILLKFSNNLPVDCLFVDLQTTRYNPPAHDLISFLYLSTGREFRAKYISAIINDYYEEISQTFKDYGIDVFSLLPYNDFLQSCEDMKEFAVTQCMSHFQNIMLTSDQIKDLFSDPEFGRRNMFEDRSPFILKICSSDVFYKEKMQECILNFKEICESANNLDD